MADILTPVPDDHIGRLALIEAVRACTDAVTRMGHHAETQDNELKAIGKTLGEMNTRLALLENSSLKLQVERNVTTIERLSDRVDALEKAEDRRSGAMGFGEALVRWWPTVVLFVAVIAVLVVTGKISL